MKNRKVNNVSVGRALALAGTLFSIGAAAACGDTTSDGGDYKIAPEVDCDTVTVKGFAALKPIFDKCTTCHSASVTGPARFAAPVGTDYDTLAGAIEEYVNIADRVYDPNLPMPPKDNMSAVLTDAEKADLNAWSHCGTPP